MLKAPLSVFLGLIASTRRRQGKKGKDVGPLFNQELRGVSHEKFYGQDGRTLKYIFFVNSLEDISSVYHSVVEKGVDKQHFIVHFCICCTSVKGI